MSDLQLQSVNTELYRPRCIAYCRVSTNNQKEDGLSIDTQKKMILEKVQSVRGDLVEDFYIDEGKTGTNMNRSGLQNLLARCSKKDIDYLVVQDTSRLSRDEKDHLVIRATLKNYSITLITLDGMQARGDDPYSAFIDLVIAGVNALHPKISGYKAHQTEVEKFKAGYYPSWAALGYKNIVNPNPTGSYDKRIIIPDETMAPFITRAFQMYATRQYSLVDIQKYLYENGVRGKKGKTLQFSVVHHMLRSTFYYGWMKWSGMEQWGKHKPLINEATFKLVQRVLTEKGDFGIRKRKHNFLLRSLIYCKECGRRFVAEWHVHPKFKSRGGRIGYYHCSQVSRNGCKAKYVELTDLEQQVEKEVAKLEFKKEFIETVERNVLRVYQESVDRVKLSKKAAYNRRDAIEQKRERLEEQMLLKNVSVENYKRINSKLESELLEVQMELSEIEKIRTVDVKIVEEVLRLTQNIVKTYSEADTDKKRSFLHFFFQKIYVRNKIVVGVEYQPVIAVLNKAKKVILVSDWLPVPQHIITLHTAIDYSKIMQAFQNLCYIGELRQRWEEIKRLQLQPALA